MVTRFQSATALLGQDGLGALALLEHLHEPAERKETDTILGFLAANSNHLRAEADGEGEDFDSEDLCERKVPRLVDENQRADEQDEVQKVHGT